MANDVKPIKIKGTIYWAFLNKTNDLSGQYQLDIAQLSDAAIKAIESLGIAVNNKNDDRGFYITCKSKYPIKVYDKNKDEITGVKVGNGSEAIAVIGAYPWQFKKKSGVSPSLKGITITNLVSYNAPADVADEEEAL